MMDEDASSDSRPNTYTSIQEDISFFFPRIKGSSRTTKTCSLVPDEPQMLKEGETLDLKLFVKQSFRLFVESTVEDVIEQALMLGKYKTLNRQLDSLLVTLRNLTTDDDMDAVYIITDSLLNGAMTVDLDDTVALLNVLSVFLKKITLRNKAAVKSHLKSRLRELLTVTKTGSTSTSETYAETTAAEVRKERERELLEQLNTSKAAIIAGILFLNDHVTQGFLATVITNLFRQMSVRGFTTICQVMMALRYLAFDFVGSSNQLDKTYLLKVYSHLNNYLNQLKKRKLIHRLDLENLRNILLSTIEGSPYESEANSEDHSPERTEDSGDSSSMEGPREHLSDTDEEYQNEECLPKLAEVDRETTIYDLPLLRYYNLID